MICWCSSPRRRLRYRSGERRMQKLSRLGKSHRAKARVIVQGFAGFERLKAEDSTIEFSGASRTLDVQGCFQNPIYSRRHCGNITHLFSCVALCAYAPTATVRSVDCLLGASAIKATPTMINTTDPINSLRAIQCSDPCTAMTAA